MTYFLFGDYNIPPTKELRWSLQVDSSSTSGSCPECDVCVDFPDPESEASEIWMSWCTTVVEVIKFKQHGSSNRRPALNLDRAGSSYLVQPRVQGSMNPIPSGSTYPMLKVFGLNNHIPFSTGLLSPRSLNIEYLDLLGWKFQLYNARS